MNDTWFGIETKQNDRPVLVRGRQHLKKLIDSGNYHESIEVAWAFNEQTENGIPTPDENEYMRNVEDALVDALESDLQSVLAIVYTHNNERTWIFYTKSTEEFGTRLNEALSEFDEVPISIEAHVDSSWELYRGILKSYNLKVK